MADSGINRVVQQLFQMARGRAGGELTDGQLLEWFLAGREEIAFEALVHRHGPMVLGVCRRVLGHAQDAEDAFQATFLVLMRKGRVVWPRAKVGNWLHGVAYRIALKARAVRVKRQAKERPMGVAGAASAAPIDAGPDWLSLLDRELNGLPAKYRIPIILCDLQGKTQHDAARQLGWREGTLSGRLSRARVLLGKRLARRGFTLSLAALTTALTAQGVQAGLVPVALAAATSKAVRFIATKQAVAAGVISAQAAALTEGVLKTMMWTKIKGAVVGILAVAIVTTGLGRAIYSASGQSKAPGVGGQGDAPKAGAPKGDAPRVVKVEGPSRKAKELDSRLRTSGKFDYKGMKLGDVLDEMRSKQGINIVVDEQALMKDEGAEFNPVDTIVSLNLTDVPLETALRYLLKSAKLGFVNQDGVLVVTTRSRTMVRKVYPVGMLLGHEEEKNAVALIQVIINTVEPESWSFISSGTAPLRHVANPFQQNIFNPAAGNQFGALGGGGNMFGMAGIGGHQFGMMGGGGMFGMMGAGPPPNPVPGSEGGPLGGQGGSIAYFPGTKTLVVRQFFEVHREIEELLTKLAEK